MSTPRLFPSLALSLAGSVSVIAQNLPDPPAPPPVPPPPLEAPLHAADRAVEQVQRHLDQANKEVQRHFEGLQRHLEFAQLSPPAAPSSALAPQAPEPPDPPDPFAPLRGQNVGGFGGGFGQLQHLGQVLEGPDWLPLELRTPISADPLIIPAGETDSARLAELREDLAIMSRLLQKAAGRIGERGDTMALGIVVSSFPALRRPQAMYLSDYGAVFLLNVSFPLAPVADAAGEPAEKPGNTAWEEARRELYGPPPVPRHGVGVVLPRTAARRETAFDAERVEALKREITDALKQAANLRQVASEEQVVVVISSTVPAPGGISREVRVHRQLHRSGTSAVPQAETTITETTSGEAAAATTLVVRVKKADADALAAGSLDRDGFAQRVTLLTY